MEGEKGVPLIFSPGNEPYLGRELLKAFDQLIVCCLEHNLEIARRTRTIKAKTAVLQEAACILIPQGLSLALSIRELIRQGHLLGAKVLMRPLVERCVTILYLHHNPADLSIWARGWAWNERPGLAKMLKPLLAKTSCDPARSYHNLTFSDQREAGNAVSKNLSRPDVCDAICAHAIPWLAVLLGMMHATFPAPEPQQASSVRALSTS